MAPFGPVGALVFVAFLVFATTGIIWLAYTLIQTDPALARQRAGLIAILSGAILVALLVASVIFRPALVPQRRGPAGFQPGAPFVGPGGVPRLPRQFPGGPPQPGAPAPAATATPSPTR